MSEERVLGDIATKLLFENDRVRIWEMRLAPGESTPVHQHEFDNILIQIDGDRVAVQPEPDTVGPYKDYQEADAFPGNYFYVEKGGIERAINIGEKEYHEIVVELKD